MATHSNNPFNILGTQERQNAVFLDNIIFLLGTYKGLVTMHFTPVDLQFPVIYDLKLILLSISLKILERRVFPIYLQQRANAENFLIPSSILCLHEKIEN